MNIVMIADYIHKKIWHVLPEKEFCVKDLLDKGVGKYNVLFKYLNVLEQAGWLERCTPLPEGYKGGRMPHYWKKKAKVM